MKYLLLTILIFAPKASAVNYSKLVLATLLPTSGSSFAFHYMKTPSDSTRLGLKKFDAEEFYEEESRDVEPLLDVQQSKDLAIASPTWMQILYKLFAEDFYDSNHHSIIAESFSEHYVDAFYKSLHEDFDVGSQLAVYQVDSLKDPMSSLARQVQFKFKQASNRYESELDETQWIKFEAGDEIDAAMLLFVKRSTSKKLVLETIENLRTLGVKKIYWLALDLDGYLRLLNELFGVPYKRLKIMLGMASFVADPLNRNLRSIKQIIEPLKKREWQTYKFYSGIPAEAAILELDEKI